MVTYESFSARMVATNRKIELLKQPDKEDRHDRAWKAIDQIISKIYRYLDDEGEDDPVTFLSDSVLGILADDYAAHGSVTTLAGLEMLSFRLQQTTRLIREFRQLIDEERVKFVQDEERVKFLFLFSGDMRRGALIKAISDELLARSVKRMAKDDD